jgi:glycosyltransferase involved in cell wall biosynthesis
MKVHLYAQESVGYPENATRTNGINCYTHITIESLLRRQKFEYELGFFDLLSANGNKARAESYFGDYNCKMIECNEIKCPNNNDITRKHLIYRNRTYAEYMNSTADVFWFPDFMSAPTLLPGKTVVTVHDTALLSLPFYGEISSARFELSLDRVMSSDAFFVADSYATKNDILKRYDTDEQRISVCYCPIHTDELYPDFDSAAVLKKYGIGESYIFVLGRLEIKKNVERIICAFEKIADKFPETQLVFAGRVSNIPEFTTSFITTLFNAKHRDRILWCGVVENDEKRKLLSKAKCLCFPSLNEGFGYPIIEAMLCGCPVLTSNTTSCPEVAGDSAVLVDPYSAPAIADGLEHLLCSDTARLRLRAQGFNRAKLFSADDSIKALENVFEKAYNS